ncbi:hypothetical protein [Bradyrhizobium sp. dw_411]|uniref:hypothetical protein n=1 Tax=Bradyrhizobium sp. dw_411 TaxID=2720082 RepID=UPI0031FE7D77
MRHDVDIKADSEVAVNIAERHAMAVKKVDLVICALPCDTVNCTIETELEAGEVILSRAAQAHAERRHPVDYPLCLPHLAVVVADPLYIGDDLQNEGIELIARVPAIGEFVLVAVNIVPDASGRYHIASFYMVSEKKIASRREKGYLKVAKKA